MDDPLTPKTRSDKLSAMSKDEMKLFLLAESKKRVTDTIAARRKATTEENSASSDASPSRGDEGQKVPRWKKKRQARKEQAASGASPLAEPGAEDSIQQPADSSGDAPAAAAAVAMVEQPPSPSLTETSQLMAHAEKAHLHPPPRHKHTHPWRQVFHLIDKNGDGEITMKELTRFVKALPPPC